VSGRGEKNFLASLRKGKGFDLYFLYWFNAGSIGQGSKIYFVQ